MKKLKSIWIVVIVLAAALVIGQAISFFVAPNSWNAFFSR